MRLSRFSLLNLSDNVYHTPLIAIGYALAMGLLIGSYFPCDAQSKDLPKPSTVVGRTTRQEVKPMASETFKKPDLNQLKSLLNPQQYQCTQENGTEKPFSNEYWNHHEDGLYVDVVSGEPLFSSLDKYDSGSGWPSFTASIASQGLVQKDDHSAGMKRIELRSKTADSHLGHLFDDGPGPDKKRFCINSASLKFIPLKDLKSKGMGQYLFLFAQKKGWQVATFAGGCFWGMEELIRTQPGVIETQVGYTGGDIENPRYEQVKTGRTNHAEAIEVLFDPAKTNYEALLTFFFKMHDPTTKHRQGNDIGSQYRSAIFFHSEDQKATALKMIERVNASHAWGPNPVVTEVTKAKKFYRAEDYHQKYLEKKPDGYTCHYLRKVTF